MGNKIYGYARVSSVNQNVDRQLLEFARRKIEKQNIFVDKVSGKNFERNEYQKMISKLKSGDVLYIVSIDRLGRNYEEILNQWRIITRVKNADICVLDMPMLDTRKEKDLLYSYISDTVLQLLSFVAENERNLIRKRQEEGIRAAKRKGVIFGRPCKKLPSNFDEIVSLWKNKEISIDEALHRSGVSQATFYRKVNECDNKKFSKSILFEKVNNI